MKEIAKVIQTSDYSKFVFLNGNRDINEKQLIRLEKSIKERRLLSPIIVSKKYEILDGQHRYLCLKKLNLPIDYIVFNESKGISDVHRYNSNSNNWTTSDYMDSYANQGEKNYLLYKKFFQKYNFTHSSTISLLSLNISNRGNQINDFKNKSLSIPNLNESEFIAEQISSIKDFYDGYKRDSFVLCVYSLLRNENFNFNEFINKLKLQPNKLTHCVNMRDYREIIEDIYNYKRREKINLRF